MPAILIRFSLLTLLFSSVTPFRVCNAMRE
jgi:hypothetical protein